MPVETTNRDEELHWLALRLVPGLGTRSAGKLIAQFRTPQAVFRASRTELEGAGLSGALAQSIASGCTFEDAVVQQEKMLESATAAIAITDRATRRCCAKSMIRRCCCLHAARPPCSSPPCWAWWARGVPLRTA